MRPEADTRAFIPKAMARLRSGDGIRIVPDLTYQIGELEVKHGTLVLACTRFLNGLGPDPTDADTPAATAAYELVAEVEA